jgi:hypothetical protein
MNDGFLTKIPNLKVVAEIYKSKNEDRNSFLRLLKALGFESEAEYTKFFNTQNNYKKILNEKFDFGSLTTTEKSSLVSKLAVLLITDSKTSLSYSPYGKLSLVDPNGQSTCSERRSSCNRSASATYTMEGLACIGAATLVGSGTFGLGGAAIYGICVSAAAVHYSSMLDDCNYAYEDCMGFKPRTTD